MREWLSGRASPCQGECREFESRLPLQMTTFVVFFISLILNTGENMTLGLKDLIELAEIKEKQALAFTGYLNGKVEDEELQKMVDNYCYNMAVSFITKYKELLEDEQIYYGLRRHISSIKADKPHSGHRFFESLYKNLNDNTKEINFES